MAGPLRTSPVSRILYATDLFPFQLASGGDIFTNDPCVKLAGEDGINALLAGDDPCAQQVSILVFCAEPKSR